MRKNLSLCSTGFPFKFKDRNFLRNLNRSSCEDKRNCLLIYARLDDMHWGIQTPSFVSMTLFPALKIMRLSSSSRFSIFLIFLKQVSNVFELISLIKYLILLPKTLRTSSFLSLRFSNFAIALNVRFSSFSSFNASRFSILSILLNANDKMRRFGKIQRLSIRKISERNYVLKKKYHSQHF